MAESRSSCEEVENVTATFDADEMARLYEEEYILGEDSWNFANRNVINTTDDTPLPTPSPTPSPT
eukprot:CAMPEP_0119139204 /NCGR_PEP_ID=MMETSP1310-20130426/27091_1 /TAXON_ID=464262 /ORGANISM="Genus nov. species nov., Strain RCC2339" /LENGTH=64 /DNA_ID=CAMNT_0007130471 /DNA_START=283 /DNA_END=474 /DNA_ORIENTATION=-